MLDEAKAEKYGALGGIWFVVLAIVGAALTGGPVSRTDTAAEIAEWYADNDSAIQISAFLTGLAIVGIVWWFGSLWQAMRRADASQRLMVISVVGFLISGTMAIAGFAIQAGAASAIELLGEGSAFFNEISAVFLSFSAVGDVVMVGAVSIVALRTNFLPKPLAQYGLLVAAVALVASLGVATDSDGIALLGFIGFLAWALWIVLISAHLYKTSPSDA